MATTTTAPTKILALDLGKFKTVCCVMDVATRQHTFDTVSTTPADLRDWMKQHATLDSVATHVVFETCDTAG